MAAHVIGSRRYATGAFLIAFAVCAIDVVSKVLVVADLAPHRPVALLGGLITLHLYRNPGAAFGIGPSYTVMYALIEAGVLAAILRLSRRLRSWPWAIALGLLLGGAAGNLADRLFRSPSPLHGFVIDWIKLPYFPPTFNLADSAITIGAVVLALAAVRGWRLDGDDCHQAPPAQTPHPNPIKAAEGRTKTRLIEDPVYGPVIGLIYKWRVSERPSTTGTSTRSPSTRPSPAPPPRPSQTCSPTPAPTTTPGPHQTPDPPPKIMFPI